MSWEAVKWALDESSATSAPAVAVLVAIAEHAAADGTNAYPSIETIARRARLSRRQTQTWVRRLEASGDLVRREWRSTRGTSVAWDLPVQPAAPVRSTAPPEECSPPHAPRAAGRTPPVQPAAPEPSVSSVNPPRDRISDEGERLCELLAELRQANGCKRPTIDRAWRRAAAELLEKDGRPVAEVERVLRWSQADDFWSPLISSMPKLVEKYDTLRLKANATATPVVMSRRRNCAGCGGDFEPDQLRQGHCGPCEEERERKAWAA